MLVREKPAKDPMHNFHANNRPKIEEPLRRIKELWWERQLLWL